MKWRAIVMGLVLLGSAAASADPAITPRTAVAGTGLSAPALQPGVTRVYSRSDGGLSMRMANGSTAYAWPTSRGYTVTFPGSQTGAQIWTRTGRGWSVTQLPSAQDPTSAAALCTGRRPSARHERRIGERVRHGNAVLNATTQP